MDDNEKLQALVAQWKQIDDAYEDFKGRRYFCVRRLLQHWWGEEATDDMIWAVCTEAELLGYNPLPPPRQNPLPHRNLIRALMMWNESLPMRRVPMYLVDKAYSIAFPEAMPINVYKKKRYALQLLQ